MHKVTRSILSLGKTSGLFPRPYRRLAFNRVKDFVVKAWKETYPDEDDRRQDFKTKVELAKAEAVRVREERQKYEEMSEEDLAKLEEQIPEHRRRSLVFVKEDEPALPLSARLKQRVYSYLKASGLDDELKKNNISIEEFEAELDRLAEGKNTFKENVKSKVVDRDNEITKVAQRALASLSGTGKAVERMQKILPDFDIFELEDDAEQIFKDVYEAFLRREEEYVCKIADGEARGLFKANIKKWEEMQLKPRVEKIWFFENCSLAKADVINGVPSFMFTVRMQEIECLESTKEEDAGKDIVVSGSDKNIVNNTYMFTLTLHDDPDLETVGHQWKMSEFRLADNRKMLL